MSSLCACSLCTAWQYCVSILYGVYRDKIGVVQSSLPELCACNRVVGIPQKVFGELHHIFTVQEALMLPVHIRQSHTCSEDATCCIARELIKMVVCKQNRVYSHLFLLHSQRKGYRDEVNNALSCQHTAILTFSLSRTLELPSLYPCSFSLKMNCYY